METRTTYSDPDLPGLELVGVEGGLEVYQDGVHQTNIKHWGFLGDFAAGYLAGRLSK